MPAQGSRPVDQPRSPDGTPPAAPAGAPRRGGGLVAGLGTWLTTRPPAAVDAAWAVPLAVLVLVSGVSGPSPLLGLLGAVEVAALLLRRRDPVVCVVVVDLAAFAHWALWAVRRTGGTPLLITDVAVLVALYSVAAHGPRWARWAGLGGAALGALLTGASEVIGPFVGGRGALGALLAAAFAAAVVLGVALLAWTAGQLRRVSRARAVATLESARRAQAVSEQRALVAAGEERARIARELHDVVAHSLSVVIAQADGGRYAAAGDPAAAVRALETVAATGRSALGDMRRLLGVLREGDGDAVAATAPQPGAGDLAALVASVRASGLDVALTRTGAPRPLAPTAGLALYRGVQESLTNVLKHAGPGAWARVALTWRVGAVEVRVDDGGGGAMVAGGGDGAGRGLLGMRERLALHGGTVVAGPREGGGFTVAIHLPLGGRS